MIVAGIGCRPGVRADEIMACLRLAESQLGKAAELLAVPFFRAEEAAVSDVARQLALQLQIVDDPALSEMQSVCPTRSERALQSTGYASVAEGCALAAAGGTAALLCVPRQTLGNVTCALAIAEKGLS